MCIGIPAQIVAIIQDGDSENGMVEINGVRREVNLSLVGSHDEQGNCRIGQWVLVHVGFAMSVIDQQQAQATLISLHQVFDADFLYEGEDDHALR